MSHNDAKSSESSKVFKKFKCTDEREKQELGTEIEVKGRSNLNNFQDDEVSCNSEFGVKVADADTNGDKGIDQSESIIQFLFGPQINLNVYVIAEIAKLLDFQDLKSLRQVDKLWSEGATPTFLRKSILVLSSGKRSWKKLKAFEAETKNLKGLTAIKIARRNQFNLGFKKEPQMFIHILTKLSPTLKTLVLIISSNQSFLPQASIQFPASAPNLAELVVPRFCPPVLLSLLTDDGSRNWSLAPKLNSFATVLSSFCINKLSTLANFPQTWERLEINALGEDLELLSVLLEKNKDSCVNLELKVDMKAELKLPTAFSKLQKLELSFKDSFRSSVNLGGRGIYYSKTFPALNSLSVELKHRRWLSREVSLRIWKFLFPPQVNGGLKRFVFHAPRNKYYYDEFLRREGIDGDWAQTMFPNARVQINLT